MSVEQAERGLTFGQQVAFGEMGIGNTSSASAIQSLIMNLPIEQCVGLGTGIAKENFDRKTQILKKTVRFHAERLQQKASDPMEIIAAVGGFEIVQIVGGMLHAAEHKKAILVDGYIVTAAAMLAVKLYPNSREYMIFCHQSNEQGHQMMLNHLEAKPLLDLRLRLGEGTGAVLALPLIKAAAKFYNDMASFESAGVTDVVN